MRSSRYRVLCLAVAAIGMIAGPTEPSARARPAPMPTQVHSGLTEQWGRILTVTPRWVVIQNDEGKQYPVSIDAIGLFLIRWPTTIDRVSPSALVEATGFDRGTNAVMTDHLDVYEGSARSLVTPGFMLLRGSAFFYRTYDFTGNMSASLGMPFGTANPATDPTLNPAAPALVHMVGPLGSINPASVQIPGNNAYMILPSPSGITVSQITPGNSGLLKPGDLVYLSVFEMRPRSLVLDQMIVYKTMPMDRFAP